MALNRAIFILHFVMMHYMGGVHDDGDVLFARWLLCRQM